MADLNEVMYSKLSTLIEVMGNEVTYEVFKALNNDLAEELIERMWSLWDMDSEEDDTPGCTGCKYEQLCKDRPHSPCFAELDKEE